MLYTKLNACLALTASPLVVALIASLISDSLVRGLLVGMCGQNLCKGLL